MNYKILPGIVVLFAVALGVKAQDGTMSFTLKEAQDYAIEHYFESVNAKMDVEKAQKLVWETTAIGLPQVSGELSYQHILGDIPEFDMSEVMEQIGGVINNAVDTLYQIHNIQPESGGDQPQESAGSPIAPRSTIAYSATVSQLIFSGEYIVGLQASKVYKALSEENYENTVINVKENVASTYYGILVLEDNLKSLKKTLENAKLTLSHTQSYYKQGLVEDTDVDQLNLMVNNIENSFKSINRQISTMYALFNFQLGLGVDTQINLKENIDELIALNIINQDELKLDLESNINYKMLDTQTELMKLDMNRYKTQYLPTVAAFYQYNDKTEKSALDFTINHIVGVTVSVPIFSSGQRMAKVGEARIDYEKAVNMQEQQTEMIKIAAVQSKNNYQTAVEKYDNEKSSVEIAEKILNKTSEKYKQGMVSSIDLAQVNNQYLQAQMSYSMAVQELLNAKIQLDKTHNKL